MEDVHNSLENLNDSGEKTGTELLIAGGVGLQSSRCLGSNESALTMIKVARGGTTAGFSSLEPKISFILLPRPPFSKRKLLHKFFKKERKETVGSSIC